MSHFSKATCIFTAILLPYAKCVYRSKSIYKCRAKYYLLKWQFIQYNSSSWYRLSVSCSHSKYTESTLACFNSCIDLLISLTRLSWVNYMLKISPNWNAFRPIYVPQYFHYAKYFPIIIIKTLNQWLVFTQLQTIILLWPQSIFKELNSNIYDCSLAYYTFYYTGIFDAGPSTTVCDTQDRSIGMTSRWISDCLLQQVSTLSEYLNLFAI